MSFMQSPHRRDKTDGLTVRAGRQGARLHGRGISENEHGRLCSFQIWVCHLFTGAKPMRSDKIGSTLEQGQPNFPIAWGAVFSFDMPQAPNLVWDESFLRYEAISVS